MSTEENRTAQRKAWMQVLARTESQELEAACRQLSPLPAYRLIRRPETGMVMVQARAGGVGQAFNMGETTLTRCTLQLDGGPTGTAYVLGRAPRHAELAALMDAMLQDPAYAQEIQTTVISPLANRLLARKKDQARKTAATKVDFFTMVRGE
jgi:alpha-D-ribose 1-methylphosphonate 5-triphosphate synthase subunit PhnG